jgi:[acyl-carrier-protein] S-malonyltransferase
MIAFLFPGQGSQKIGMGKALFDACPQARAVFEEADDALGFSISKLCFEGPEAELTLTANAQPAIVTTSIAALRVIEAETSLSPGVVAGHSLGEYAALVAAGGLRFADAVRLVHLRGRFMQDAVSPGVGAMAAILGLAPADVEAGCALVRAETGEVVSPANLNGGGQVVIAGSKLGVDRAIEVLKQKGAKRALPLSVSAPFHCALMKPAADRLAQELEKVEVAALRIPVVTNVEAAPNQEAGRVRQLLTAQVTAPVRWEESVGQIVSMGATRAIEVGHGAVLAGLAKRIAPELSVVGAGDLDAIRSLR